MFASLGYFICIPFAWLLRVFYNLTSSYGVAIILFTIAIKLILWPFQIKSKRSMMRMSRLNGQIQEIQKKYANNQAKMSEEMQKLYAEEGVNPTSGCLWSFLPLPILIALYSIIRQPITHFMMLSKETLENLITIAKDAGINMSNILMFDKVGAEVVKDGFHQMNAYGQINLIKELSSKAPAAMENVEGWINVNYNFVGLDLTVNPWDALKNFTFEMAVIGLILIPILAGLFQFIMSWYTMKTQPSAGGANMKTMMYMMPLMSVYFAFIMPAALGVYWIAQSLFSLIQEIIMTNTISKKMKAEEDARYESIQADRKRRQEEAKALQEERKKQEQQKQSLKEKRQAAEAAKAAKAKKAGTSTTEAGRVGDRPYARGRAYKEDRYDV